MYSCSIWQVLLLTEGVSWRVILLQSVIKLGGKGPGIKSVSMMKYTDDYEIS